MADARTAILITLDPAHEGGFQANPHDRANWTSGQVGVGTLVGTNGGITALDMPGADIKNLTVDQKVAFSRHARKGSSIDVWVLLQSNDAPQMTLESA